MSEDLFQATMTHKNTARTLYLNA